MRNLRPEDDLNIVRLLAFGTPAGIALRGIWAVEDPQVQRMSVVGGPRSVPTTLGRGLGNLLKAMAVQAGWQCRSGPRVPIGYFVLLARVLRRDEVSSGWTCFLASANSPELELAQAAAVSMGESAGGSSSGLGAGTA